jgi:hypothetical protein
MVQGRDNIFPQEKPCLLTMGFEELAPILGLRDVETSSRICLADQGLLGAVAGHGDASCASVLIYAGLTDDALDSIPVTQCLAERLENY